MDDCEDAEYELATNKKLFKRTLVDFLKAWDRIECQVSLCRLGLTGTLRIYIENDAGLNVDIEKLSPVHPIGKAFLELVDHETIMEALVHGIGVVDALVAHNSDKYPVPKEIQELERYLDTMGEIAKVLGVRINVPRNANMWNFKGKFTKVATLPVEALKIPEELMRLLPGKGYKSKKETLVELVEQKS